MNWKNKVIGILSGGFSNEREVSLRSGQNVFNILKNGGYQVVLLDLKSRTELPDLIKQNRVDIVFNVLHGKYGEDGGVQSDLDFLGVPYTGSNAHASSLSMNKYWTKLIVKSIGIPTIEGTILYAGESLSDKAKNMRYPYFIKPVDEGSSRNTHIVEHESVAQNLILDSYTSYLIEDYIKGPEVTSGVISVQGEYIKFPILQVIPSNPYSDYEAKYTAGKTEYVCPAKLSEEQTNLIQSYSVQVHRILGCQGATRCDFLIDEQTNIAYFLEINTSSGMTEGSDIPLEARAMGWSDLQLCEAILKSAVKTNYES